MLLVTGDEASCREGAALLGERLTTVAVKRGLGQTSARMIPPVRARQLIEAGATRALSDLKAVPPYDPGRPSEIRVEYKKFDDAMAAKKWAAARDALEKVISIDPVKVNNREYQARKKKLEDAVQKG